jgi:hypothetical protein
MFRRLVVCTLATVATLAMPVAAQGATLNLVDARGDVYRDVAKGAPKPAPGERSADIVRTKIVHAQRAVVVRTQLVRLNREGTALGMSMRVRTNEGLYREVDVFALRPRWRGGVDVMKRNGSSAECTTAHRFNYARDYIAVRIPRSCLGDPRWVQATVMSFSAARQRFLLDNPHNDTARLNVWSSRIRRG